MIRFINREYELEELNKLWNLENAFIVVYGRRRIGKTRLIREFLKDKKGVSFTAEDTNKAIQIREFKQAIANFFNDEFLRNQEINSWSSLLSYISKLDVKQKFYIWIDEFSYVIKNNKSAASAFQKFIDDYLRSSKIFFIVSGSIFGVMSEKVLSSTSPLYGRRTKDFLLGQLCLQHSAEFLQWNKFQDVLQCYMTVGGVPEYLLVASRYKNFNSFIQNEFFKKDAYFYREPYFLLSREFKEIKTYFSILNAISSGNTKPTEIANFVGLNTREIYPYLDLLISYGFIKRVANFSNPKAGVYVVNDAFFDFWFNFVYKNREEIERDDYKASKKQLNMFFGKRFEIFIRQNFASFFKNYSVTKWWFKDKEIDIVALNEEKKEVLFGECKWQANVNAEKIVKELVEKSQFVQWFNNEREESFAVFAKSFKKRVNSFEGKPVHCFDLKDLERVFKLKKRKI
ncbi:ATP-binding protein [Candidatus Woesearchaeota archaeon]|nr:ATP-binding protein [Candidatus Woesearchaeota archaeon]